MFIDSHAHLADAAFDADRDEVISRARAAGAAAIVCIGESLPAADRARELALMNPGFIAYTAGVHPHDAAGFDPAMHIPAIRSHLTAGAVAIGECGLDYHYDNSPRQEQRAAFQAQLALARETGAPVVVHSREAERDTAELVTEAGRGGVRGVLHCFTGPAALARAALDAGWHISFSGIITFRAWNDDESLRFVPDDRVLVESDAPYLSPIPHRGRRNEPGWVSLTLARLAYVRDCDVAELGVRVSANARSFFGLAGWEAG